MTPRIAVVATLQLLALAGCAAEPVEVDRKTGGLKARLSWLQRVLPAASPPGGTHLVPIELPAPPRVASTSPLGLEESIGHE